MTDPRWFVAALAGFTNMTTARLAALLNHRTPEAAFAAAAGHTDPTDALASMFERSPGLRAHWQRSGTERDPEAVGRACERLGVSVVLPDDDAYPRILVDDPQRPAVLFMQGDPAALAQRRVGIVGTRNPTQQGLQTAVRFGHELSAAGVGVVSGLAKGIDGAAHRGALAVVGSKPIAVVANGHGQPYPKRHATLWAEVAERGIIVSEWPPGTAPDAFRFPQRNRILAALSEIIVVVESRERGGSLITAQLAAERGIDVFAVPGPVTARSSIGTNQLIRDGAAVATDPDDVVLALGLDGRRAGRVRYDARARPRGSESVVLELCRREPRDVEGVSEQLGCSIAEAAMLLARLERSGWLCETGGWFEAVDEWAVYL
ncbi:DNA-processing protein DprA [Ilumatobacter coccineus]|uniref:DNA processing protein DprA n=1 Tax=Ilumatobacter coccineus (strain NBRC 103263 / KCTC 29153 / YM16-304) TaxID=1313172 RepID=A0A6C7E8M7_ILUCY|nr:DNA-processing protein DprA [Ilumatobacter coccineus]BAN03067.1 DNA processing protein DprA [Ilumatobacter coccineus YM16-304]